jgi:hypothetical protein
MPEPFPPRLPTRQGTEQAVEPLQGVPVPREHPAVDGVGHAPEAVELEFPDPLGRIDESFLAMG